MDSINKTLYIPLYGKAFVSRKALFICDSKAEEIWSKVGFTLKGKSRSKWLAYYMGIRSAVFDEWVKQQLSEHKNASVIHIGCGLDSRILRVGTVDGMWYDVDFPDVIAERKHYFIESDTYRMLSADVRNSDWLSDIPKCDCAVIVMEGASMYLTESELSGLIESLTSHFKSIALLADFYTVLGAKMSKYKNPVNDVGVTRVYGIDDPKLLENGTLRFVKEHDMTPQKFVDELNGIEKYIFGKLYGGKFSKKLYRMFEYKTLN